MSNILYMCVFAFDFLFFFIINFHVKINGINATLTFQYNLISIFYDIIDQNL